MTKRKMPLPRPERRPMPTGGIGFGAGFGMAPLMFGVALKLAQDPVLATLAAVGGFLTAQGIARALFIRTARGRERTLRELVERLSALARGELANRKQLPP